MPIHDGTLDSVFLIHTLKVAGDIVTPTEPAALRIEIVGEQFWWRVHCLNAAGWVEVPTASEIHLRDRITTWET